MASKNTISHEEIQSSVRLSWGNVKPFERKFPNRKALEDKKKCRKPVDFS